MVVASGFVAPAGRRCGASGGSPQAERRKVLPERRMRTRADVEIPEPANIGSS